MLPQQVPAAVGVLGSPNSLVEAFTAHCPAAKLAPEIFVMSLMVLASGKRLHNYGKSLCFDGKIHYVNGHGQ